MFMWSNTSQSLHMAQVTDPGLAIATCSGLSSFRSYVSQDFRPPSPWFSSKDVNFMIASELGAVCVCY